MKRKGRGCGIRSVGLREDKILEALSRSMPAKTEYRLDRSELQYVLAIEIVDHQRTNTMHLHDGAGSISSEMRLPARNHRKGTSCKRTQNVGCEAFAEADRDLSCNHLRRCSRRFAGRDEIEFRRLIADRHG